MFTKLGDFSVKRTVKEAIGFYISYFLGIMVAAMAITAIIASATGRTNDFDFGVMIGQMVAILASLTLSMLVLAKKNMLNSNNVPFILLALSSAFLAYLGGGMLGLIPAAYLSTR